MMVCHFSAVSIVFLYKVKGKKLFDQKVLLSILHQSLSL